MKQNKVIDALLGVAIGDAVGVPFEFKSNEEMQLNPATDITGYGTYNQPPGTWSDDSSLTLCLAESLCNGYDLKDMASKFIAWRTEAYWTAHNEVFDIGMTTQNAIHRLQELLEKEDYDELKRQRFYGDEYENGNGSLMRIMPLLFHIEGKSIAEQFDLIWSASALTHRHIRAAMCCLIYLRLAEHLLNGMDKVAAYELMKKEVLAFWTVMGFSQNEQKLFIRLMERDVRDVPRNELRSGGYVMESIQASIWCLLKTDNYKDAILTGINLGHDTDTTAAITGGLAGLYYGMESIPEHWRLQTARLSDILDLGERLNTRWQASKV